VVLTLHYYLSYVVTGKFVQVDAGSAARVVFTAGGVFIVYVAVSGPKVAPPIIVFYVVYMVDLYGHRANYVEKG